MQNLFETLKLFFKNKGIYTIIAIYSINVLVLGFIAHTGYSIYTIYQKMQLEQAEVDKYKNSVTLIQNNKELVANDLDSYNDTLQKAIPDKETYFSVVTSLEQLASRTGVTIVSYSINIETTTASKLSLDIELVGPPAAIQKFYKSYQFAGGRLITTEKINFSGSDDGKVTASMNFYHQPYLSSGDTTIQSVSQKDIDFINEIKSKL